MKRLIPVIAMAIMSLQSAFAGLEQDGEGVYINEVLSSNVSSNYDPDFGAFSDWIELYNPSDGDIDMAGWYLSDDPDNRGKWEMPVNTIIPGKGYLLFWADGKDLVPGQKAYVTFTEKKEITIGGYHLNFRINREREYLFLSDAGLQLQDSILLMHQEHTIPFGRDREDPGRWVYLGEPSPMEENSVYSSPTYARTGTPRFSINGGHYQGAQTLVLESDASGQIVKYTSDGSEPTVGSTTYNGPVTIAFSQVIKARIYEEGKLPGKVLTETYIIESTTSLPILSVSTDHQNLWGFDFGIYQNNYKNREIYAHLEYFDESGQKAFSIPAGLQLFGSQIFQFDQKPFSIYFRKRYGQDSLKYKLFKNKQIDAFESLVLRNGGNDNNLTMFRDGLGAALVENILDIDYQAYQAVVVYMNGEYWGIFNLREKLNEAYLSGNHDANPDYIDILEDSLSVNNGNANKYQRLIRFAEQNDLRQEENYRYVTGQIDLNAYINYMSYKIYGGYKQWQVNNKYWRERDDVGKWRWIAFDMEHCFAGPGGQRHDENPFQYVLQSESSSWHTLLFRKLMENEAFRSAFLQSSALYLNTVFSEERVLQVIDSLQNLIAGEMPEHIAKWEAPVSVGAWQQHVSHMEEFAANRNSAMFSHMMEYFHIPDTSRLTVVSTDGGTVLVSSTHVLKTDSVWFTLFDSIPLKLVALPEPGYSFAGWNNINSAREINLVMRNDTTLKAVFEKDERYLLPDTVKNTLVIQSSAQAYSARGNIVIPDGDSLIIEQGVSIHMAPGASLMNLGYLSIAGNLVSPVTIDINRNMLNNSNGHGNTVWGGIIIDSGEAYISYTELNNASAGVAEGNFKGSISVVNSNAVLRGLRIADVKNPVYAYNSSILIDSCMLSSKGAGDLINLKDCQDPVIRNCDLKGNFYEDTDAIDLDNVSGALVEYNSIYSFFGYNSDGIDLGEGSSGILIRNNRIVGCADKGISVGQGSVIEARNNIIVDCNQGFGIKDFGSFALINQNTLYANRTGIACFEKNPGNGGGGAQVENTIIAQSIEQAIYVDALSSIEIAYSLSDRDSLPGEQNLLGNPGFTQAALLDFYLQENSLCLDSGDPEKNDPDGSRADRGAVSGLSIGQQTGVLITELNYRSHEKHNTCDWIELYNPGPGDLDVSNWILKGNNNSDEFVLPDRLNIAEGSYLLIAENKDSLQNHHDMSQVADGLGFGLGRDGELLRLYDDAYQLVHSIRYHSEYPWPGGANAMGATLELFRGESENSDPQNWHDSYIGGGTPGADNSETTLVTGLYINELMARNDWAFSDEYGEYDDWLEIYNSSDAAIDLGGMQFILEEDRSKMFMVPFFDESTVIESHGYKLFWADKDTEQGVLHADFNLPATGGKIGIGQHIDKQIQYTDRIVYESMDSDEAFGRFPDGDVFLSLLTLTPGNSNILLNNDQKLIRDFELYPNPADQYFMIETPEPLMATEAFLYSINGRVVKKITLNPGELTRVSITDLSRGIYLLKINGLSYAKRIVVY